VSSDAHADALKAYLTAAAKAPVLDLDEIRALASTPARYVEMHLQKRYGGQPRLDGSQNSDLRRLSTRVVADSITNGRLIEDWIAQAFQFTLVDLGDTKILATYESGGGDFAWDDGYWTALTDWTFGI
jgi:hypothetical protein